MPVPVINNYSPITKTQADIAETFIKDIEDDNGIEIMYAVDTGPISYGLNNPRAQQTMRFIYRNKKIEDHFVLSGQINNFAAKSSDIEAQGFYITKALNMVMRSDPLILEMLESSLKYKRGFTFYRALDLAAKSYSPKALANQHYTMLKYHLKENFKTGAKSTTATYIKAIYHIMVLKWIFKSPQLRPPTNLSALINRDEVLDCTRDLMRDCMSRYTDHGDIKHVSPTLFNFFSSTKNWIPPIIRTNPTIIERTPNMIALRDLHYKAVSGIPLTYLS